MINKQDLRDTRVIVDLDNITWNMKLIDEMTGPDVAVMAVVKANGYGHGSIAIAPTLIENGACYLAVATLSEALLTMSWSKTSPRRSLPCSRRKC